MDRTKSRISRTVARRSTFNRAAGRPALIVLCLAIFAVGIASLPNATRNVTAQNTQDKSQNIPSVQSVTPKGTVPDDKEEGDADVPTRFKGLIDKQTYLNLRHQHTSLLRGIEEDKTFDPQWRSNALHQMEQQELANAPGVNGTTWTEIGPFPLPNGQTQNGGAVTPVSGRATAVVVDPTNSNKVYLGTAQGGVWRSTNGGTTWAAIFDTAQSLSIGAIALAPSNPSILYVGTGESNSSVDSFFGVGVYRIDNVDTTADLVGPINPSFTFFAPSVGGNVTTTCFGGRGISKILVSPSDPATIFVSTGSGAGGIGGNTLSQFIPPMALLGVYRSTNATAAAGSIVFTKLAVTTDTSLDLPATGNTTVNDLAFEPGTPNNLLATVSGTSLAGGVFRSTNALAATPVFVQTLTPPFTGLVMKLAINKVAAIVTAYVSSNEPGTMAQPFLKSCPGAAFGRVRKSTDGGQTWSTPLADAEGYCGGQCSYDNPIGVHPSNASIVYLGGNARGTCSDALKRSSNGGTTFIRDDTDVHADAHAIGFDPLTSPVTVWFANDGGIWKRQDAAAGTAWLSQNNGPLGTLQFQSIAVHPTNQNFTIGGTQDNGTELLQQPANTWTRADFGDGGFALIDQNATDTTTVTMYHTYFNLPGVLLGFGRTNTVACATEGEWAFKGIYGGTVESNVYCDGSTDTFNGISLADSAVLFYAPIAMGPGNPNRVYYGSDRLYRSINKGDTMAVVSQQFAANVPISAIGIKPTDDNARIVGLRNGLAFKTLTGANPMSASGFTAPANATNSATNKFISRAVIDPVLANSAYITLSYFTNPASQQVWKTTNLNAVTPTWTEASNGIPDIPVNAFAVDPSDPTLPGVSVLYAGTDIGVYRSTDAGANWTTFGIGLPRSAVFDMAIQPTSRILRVATHGRGMWEIALPGSPTAAKLNAFTARLSDDGRVLIQWSTGAEVDNLGFNVYREQDGRRVRITPQLVAGSALLAGPQTRLMSGNAYVWSDSPPQGKPVKYLLEDIDLKGKSAWNGPIAVGNSGGKGTGASAQQRAALLTRLGFRQAQLSGGLASTPAEVSAKLPAVAPPFSIAGGAATKLSVNHEGWYRVTQPELVAAGLDSKVNPRLLQLFVDGRDVPIAVQGEQDGRFDPADAVEFYGVGLDAASSTSRVYWLVAGSQPGRRIQKTRVKGLPGAAASFAYTVERKDRTIYFSALRNGDAENFFGPVIAREAVVQSLTLQHIDRTSSTAAQVEVALQGVTQQAHRVKVLVNGAEVGSVLFAGQSRGVARLPVSNSTLVEGENLVRLLAQAGETDVSLVDSVSITYQRRHIADGNALRLTVNAAQQFTIDGFTSGDARVLDVTNPDAVQELATVIKQQKGGYAVTATVAGSGQRTLLALTPARASQVAGVRANQPSGWRQPSNGADLLIITHRDFSAALGRLKSLRESQGLRVALVEVEDVFDEFSYGQKTPQALKAFLAYAKGNWNTMPRFVVLAGDASLDPKDYLGYGDSDYLPTKLIDTQNLETASDNWLADLDGDGVEDLAIGRLPVRSAQEAASLVNKIVSYEDAGSSGSVLLVADRNDGYDFESSNTKLRSLIPAGLKVEQIDRGRLDDKTAKSMFVDAVNKGQMIVNYTGHGSVSNWRGELLTSPDALSLTNADRLSLFVTMTCLNGYYQDPVIDSLAESLLKADRGGAVAVWASSGMTQPAGQMLINQQLYRMIFGEEAMTLGEATLKAKSAVADGDIRRTWILLGDPSMKLK